MIITIEGTDASGKATQSKALYEYLLQKGKPCKLISFPRYDSESSYFIKRLLNGDYGNKYLGLPGSIFYGVDRADYFGSSEITEFLEGGGILICDRYTTSNFVHQAMFGKDKDEVIQIINKVKEIEYNILKIPQPDKVFFLKVASDVSQKLIEERAIKECGNKNGCENDILETKEMSIKAYNNACSVAELENWEVIECCRNGEMLSREEISNVLFQKVNSIIA